MAVDVENLPIMNYAVYQLVLQKADGNVTKFSEMIGIPQQRVNRLFQYDRRSGKYPSVSPPIMDAVTETFGISESDLIYAYRDRLVNKEDVDPARTLFNISGVKAYTHPDIKESFVREDNEKFNIGYTKGKPYFDVPFKMGYELPFNDNTSTPNYLIDFKPFNNCDFWCNCSGYSMYPTIASGDFVAMQIVRDFHLIVNNEIYGFVLKNGLRTIKRAKLNGDVFTLTPDNKEYESQDVKVDDVLYVYKVMGTVKVF